MKKLTGKLRRNREHLAATLPHLRQRPLQTASNATPQMAGGTWEYLRQFALSPWVFAAITRMSEGAANSRPDIIHRGDASQLVPDHPLLDMLGVGGLPNDYQSGLEFFEEHYSFLSLAGNSYWYWHSVTGGAPTAVYNLNPARVRVIPGQRNIIDGYEYWFEGHKITLSPHQVTHFKMFNPYNDYYGLPALESLLVDITGDRAMAEWNLDFFGDGVGIPAGVFIVDESMTDEQLERLDAEVNAKYSERRKTAIMRGQPGSAVFVDAGLKQREMDFHVGRQFGRQTVYEVLDLPLGIMSEASTEAHARVAERFFYSAVQKRLFRTQEKINTFPLRFWDGWNLYRARFEDLRARFADWQQETLKIESWLLYRTQNEIRSEYGLPPIEQSTGTAEQQGRGNTDTLQPD